MVSRPRLRWWQALGLALFVVASVWAEGLADLVLGH